MCMCVCMCVCVYVCVRACVCVCVGTETRRKDRLNSDTNVCFRSSLLTKLQDKDGDAKVCDPSQVLIVQKLWGGEDAWLTTQGV